VTEPPDDPGEPAARPGRPRQWVAVSLIGAVAAVSIVIAVTRSDPDTTASPDPEPSRSSTTPADVGVRDARAIALLAAQDRALRRGAGDTFRAGWDDGGPSQREARNVFANLAALRVQELHPRYVGANDGGLSSSEQERLGGAAWTADVDIAWRLQGVDEADARTTLTYTFVQRPDGTVAVADMAPAAAQREPVWLLGPLEVLRSDRTVVASTRPALARRADVALRRAVGDVQRVLPTWQGSLVAYAPANEEEFDQVVSAAPNAYEGIAAVTTTVDGSHSADAPVAIVVNPLVFDKLGPVGSRVVVSHEATHVATGATTVSMPLWVAEGFADYVGVGSVDVPLAVSARAAVRDVHQFGLPEQLPTNGAFQAGSGVEAVYEESWLAMRLIAREYGQRRLVAFYSAVVDRPDALGAALRETLGTTQAALTRDWRRYLQEVAGGS
jgi:hypothetical protein